MKLEEVLKIFLLFVIVILLSFILETMTEKNTNKYDVNQDGIVNAQDYVEIKNYIMEEDK